MALINLSDLPLKSHFVCLGPNQMLVALRNCPLGYVKGEKKICCGQLVKESLTLRKIASHIEQPETMWFATNPSFIFSVNRNNETVIPFFCHEWNIWLVLPCLVVVIRRLRYSSRNN
jgi:hypothetical protein